MSQPIRESKVERAKRASRELRGTVAETLASEAPCFGGDDVQVLKFHGIYQQDDRDLRRQRAARGEGKSYSFMVRVRLPGGALSAEAYLALDALADRVSSRGLRATSRQGFQLHGVLKGDLAATVAEIDRALLSTFSACGDVERNVMAPPAPFADPGHRAVRELAATIAAELCPRARSYHEIWLDGERWEPVADEADPLYGPGYLPRKLKTAVTLAGENAVDVYAQDIGLVVRTAGGRLRDVVVLVGGGLGMTHRKADTFARLATPLATVEVGRTVATVRAILTLFRDHGDRADRRHARLKYLLEDWGIERFRAELQRRIDFDLRPHARLPEMTYRDDLGVHPQGDGRYFLGLFVASGRLVDGPRARTRSAVSELVRRFRPRVMVTPGQNLLFADLAPGDLPRVDELLAAHGVPRAEDLAAVRRYSLVCPALPTCGLALTDAERALPDVLVALEDELAALGLEDEPLAVRMTGCPNGCARPYTADVGLVGRKPGHYDVYLGGGLAGGHLAELYDEEVPAAEVAATLRPLLAAWARGRRPGEGFGAFYRRRFSAAPAATLLTGAKDPGRRRLESPAAAAGG